MDGNVSIISIKQRKIKIESRIKLSHNINNILPFLVLLLSYQVKNPFQNLSDPVSFGMPSNTVNFYISGAAGKLGAW